MYTRNNNVSTSNVAHRDAVNEVLRMNSRWLVGSVAAQFLNATFVRYYNVLMADSYDSMEALLLSLTDEHYDSSGRCLLVLDDVSRLAAIRKIMVIAWDLRMVNAVLIVRGSIEGEYFAYTYDPYSGGRCEVIEPILLDQFRDGLWETLFVWFPNRLKNLHGCPVKAGTILTKPFSMVRKALNESVRFGLEVTVVENVAKHLNFSIDYRTPDGKVKWGLAHATNSTGLMGMIQRDEVEFGFGCLGNNVFRNRHLKMGTVNFVTQLTMAVPPDKPYTSLEKLFQPFSFAAWLCIVLCYAIFALLTVLLFDFHLIVPTESFRNPGYNLWVLLMGGPSWTLRRNSTRLFIVGFVLNALVIRTMYQAAMFGLLQAPTKPGTRLNSFQEINDAQLFYYMYTSTTQYYRENPLVQGRIRVLTDESKDWDEIMLDIARHKVDGVFAIPLNCIEYYVKNYAQRGIVYVGKHTGITYSMALYYGKRSPFANPFNAIISRFQAAGLMHSWKEQYRDNRYWTPVKSHSAPTTLKLQQMSGCFYLWAILLALALVFLVGEIITRKGE